MKKPGLLFLMLTFAVVACSADNNEPTLKTGAENTGDYMSLLEGKKVAVVANQTSMVGKSHLIDTLVSLGIDVKLIFAPEHGFRDLADDGAVISSGTDPVTGINVISLYATKKKPAPEDLAGIDEEDFDIHDVGTRFFT